MAEGAVKGWASSSVVGCGIAGAACLIAMVFVELNVRFPLLALRLLADKMFRTANLLIIPLYMEVFANTFLMPLYFQDLRHMSAQDSGMMLLPQAIGMMIAVSTVGRHLDHRFGPRRLIIVGSLMSALSLSFFPFLTIGTNSWLIRLLMFTRAILIPLPTIPAQTAAYSTISPSDSGRASSLYLTTRQISGALGAALAATTLTSVTRRELARVGSSPTAQAHAHLTGFRWAFATSIFGAVIAAVLGLMIDDDLAAATLRRAAPAEAQ